MFKYVRTAVLVVVVKTPVYMYIRMAYVAFGIFVFMHFDSSCQVPGALTLGAPPACPSFWNLKLKTDCSLQSRVYITGRTIVNTTYMAFSCPLTAAVLTACMYQVGTAWLRSISVE